MPTCKKCIFHNVVNSSEAVTSFTQAICDCSDAAPRFTNDCHSQNADNSVSPYCKALTMILHFISQLVRCKFGETGQRLKFLTWFKEQRWKGNAAGLCTCLNKYLKKKNISHINRYFLYTITQMAHLCFPGEDTMTGDGGEYLRAEDLRELGDDSLPGHYLDSFSYMNHNLDR